jgi:hypothetical protein
MSADTPANDSAVAAGPSRTVAWLARIGFACVVSYLCFLGVLAQARDPMIVDLSAWGMEEGAQPFSFVGRFAAAAGVEALWFALLGLLAPAAIGSWLARRRWLVRVSVIVVVGVILAAVVRGVELGAVPHAGHLLLPLAGYLVGAWIGAAALRGFKPLLWLVPKVAVVAALLVAGAAGVAALALEDAPLPFAPAKVTAAQKRRLADAIRGIRARADDPRRVQLTDEDIDLLLSVGLSRDSADRKARVNFDDGSADAEVSLKVPRAPAAASYLNASVAADVGVNEGQLQFRLRQARIGRLDVPPAVLALLSPAISSAILHDPDLKLVVCSIERLRVEKGTVDTVFRPCEFSERAVPSLARRLGGKPDVLAESQDHARNLLAVAGGLPQGDARLGELVQAAFAFARVRSEDGDPALENRAALLALAMLLGHPRVESLVGPVLDDDLRRTAPQTIGQITLRGRPDWTQHFFVSAALALLSNEQISDKIGVFKEQLDAEQGGSGFSFSDLTADRAGTRLALAATRDETSARAMQDRFAAGFHVDDVFPPAADLPEGIPAAELASRYGGVGGAGYRTVEAEIEKRLASCAALK